MSATTNLDRDRAADTAAQTRITTDRIAKGITLAGAAMFLVTGIWAFGWPESFYDNIATFPPFNEHLFHDAGAFQIGLGATLLLAVRWRDALFVALGGVGLGAAIHAVAHIIDRNEGGRSSDPVVLSIVAAVLLVGAALRWRAAMTGA